MLGVQSIVLVALTAASSGARSKDIKTTQGVVRGYLVEHQDTPYYAFRAISYARVTNRFTAPKPARRWDGTFEATYRVKCPQPDGTGTEDCLVINVFSPERATMLPVLVLVHDGNYQAGWGAFQPPGRLLARNITVVTFNYRLGPLGFLCLGIPEAPGNAGLKDQVAALYWVQKNIDKFGGNPLDVTVYGMGSGASSTQLILLAGVAKGLIHKVILESGSALAPLSLSYDPLSTAFEAAVLMGFTGTENARDLARFYKELYIKYLTNTSTLFLPCLENTLDETHSLLEKDPMEIFQEKNYHTVPMIIAYTDMLGASKTNIDVYKDNLPLPNNLKFTDDNIKLRVVEIVKDFYLAKLDPDEDSLQNNIDYFNDVAFEYPIIKSAVCHAATSSSPTYLMRFSTKDRNKSNSRKNEFFFNNFYERAYARDFNDEDLIIVEQLATLWSNFIKIGDPTPLTTSLVPVIWQPIEVARNCLDIKSVTGLILGRNLRISDQIANYRIQFWDRIYKKAYRSHNQKK